MPRQRTWWCDGCGKEQQFRTIDDHRWVRTSETNTQWAGNRRRLQLCPTCRLKFAHSELLPALRMPELFPLKEEGDRIESGGLPQPPPNAGQSE